MTKRKTQSKKSSRFQKRETGFDSLLERSEPRFESMVLPEPMIVVGRDQTCPDPKFGIDHFGPHTLSKQVIRIGIIGTAIGIELVRAYLERAKRPILPGLNSKKQHYDPFVFPLFPGVSREASLRVDFLTDKSLQREIPPRFVASALTAGDTSAKIKEISKLWVDRLETLKDLDPEPDVVITVFPSEVDDAIGTVGREFQQKRIVLTPGKKLERRLQRELGKTGQEYLPLDYEETLGEDKTGFWNLHHVIKAQAMRFGIPTQFAWESMLQGIGLTQDPASVAWNFFSALFYKSGSIPWQAQGVPSGTCFVGISFFKESPYANADRRTSLAQVFSGTGEGLVLRGDRAIVDKKRGDGRPHLDFQSSKLLLEQALTMYEQHHQTKPTRVVLHKTSRYWPEELDGFKKALGDLYSHDFLTLEKSDLRFLRLGQKPALRGTVVLLEPRHYLLYTVGYIPYFKMYPGMRVPVPLEIMEHHGDSTTERVCSEILTLTKLNWNSCSYCSSDPITTLFARSVGRILTELSGPPPQAKYRFYM